MKDAFKCEELDKVLFEIEKVQHWKQQCEDIIRPSSAEDDPLTSALMEVYANESLIFVQLCCIFFGI